MPRTDAALAEDLLRAGLVYVERITGNPRGPLPPGRSPASCLDEHGRFDSEPYEIDDPDLTSKVNASWWRLAAEFGLLDERREFLVAADGGWVRVRLADQWDLAGGGSDALRSSFGERSAPEFVMMSLDRAVIVETTVWGDATVSTIVIRPDRIG